MSNKFADIFEQTGAPYSVSIANVKKNVDTKFGKTNILTVTYNGDSYDWFLDDDKFNKSFPTDAFPGDEINVTKKVHPKNSQWTYYAVDLVSRDEEAKKQAQRPASERKKESDKDRMILDFKLGLAGVTQSLISSGLYNMEKAEEMDSMKETAKSVTRWIREAAVEMYEEEVNATKEDVDEVFGTDDPDIDVKG